MSSHNFDVDGCCTGTQRWLREYHKRLCSQYLTSSAQPEPDFPAPICFSQLQLDVIRPTCFRVLNGSVDFDLLLLLSARRVHGWHGV